MCDCTCASACSHLAMSAGKHNHSCGSALTNYAFVCLCVCLQMHCSHVKRTTLSLPMHSPNWPIQSLLWNCKGALTIAAAAAKQRAATVQMSASGEQTVLSVLILASSTQHSLRTTLKRRCVCVISTANLLQCLFHSHKLLSLFHLNVHRAWLKLFQHSRLSWTLLWMVWEQLR